MTHQGQVIKAYFSAESGGHTESALNFFKENRPYCLDRAEQYDLSRVNSAWQKTVNLTNLAAILVRAKLIAAESVIQQVLVLTSDRFKSGRVNQVTVMLTNGKSLKIPGERFRFLTSMRSTAFQIQNQSNATVQFNGNGFGHGVGLSQIGTLQYVQQLNWSSHQILKFYYTGIEIQKLAY
jgi:stage II sporulation protein D